MTGQYALLSIIYMMAFVILFDRTHFKHKWRGWARGGGLMSAEELHRIQEILSACQEN